MKNIVVLGSTGSIGAQTLDVVRKHPDELRVVGLAAGRRVSELADQARKFDVAHVAVGDSSQAESAAYADLRLQTLSRKAGSSSAAQAEGGAFAGSAASCGIGPDAVAELVHLPEVDLVVNSLVGAAGLQASYETLRAGKTLALANKESLVVGGDLLVPLSWEGLEDTSASDAGGAAAQNALRRPSERLLPIDSEHGAIFQCLIGEDMAQVAQLWVTASGGPFRGRTADQLRDITPAQALAHPTWNMGAKITIDSSTLMNKGLEVIEAHHLFAMPYDRIQVVVQPQSAIHSMVEFVDGSVKAHLGATDMRIPIQFALSYPQRWTSPVAPLDFRAMGSLEFLPPDEQTFRCLPLARHAGQTGGTLPCVMNAANEVAVAAFLAERLSYLGIAACVEHVMEKHEAAGVQRVASLEQLQDLDDWARAIAGEFVARS